MNHITTIALVFATAFTCPAAIAQERESIEQRLRELTIPPLTTEREREVWDLLRSRKHDKLLATHESEIPDIVVHLRAFTTSTAGASDWKTRRQIYQFAAGGHIASTRSGAEFLLDGMKDTDARLRLICAKGLLRCPSPMRPEIDQRHREYLESPSTSIRDRKSFLENVYSTGMVGDEVGDFALEQLQEPPNDKDDVFSLTVATLYSKGAGALVPLLHKQADPVFLTGALHALFFFASPTEGSMGTNEAGRKDLRSSVISVFQADDPEARRWAYFTILNCLGPDPYSSRESQLQIGRKVVAAVAAAREKETIPDLIEILDSFVLSIFTDDGRFKTDAEWRRDRQPSESSLGNQ